MSKKIFKYQLETTDYQTVRMPFNSVILCVQTQGQTPCIWAEVNDSTGKNENRSIRIYGTGHKMDEDVTHKYIGTYKISGGALVFHVYELI